MSSEKDVLDNFNKILLATGQINYLSSAIHCVNEDLKFLEIESMQEKIEMQDRILKRTVKRLKMILDELAGVINSGDYGLPIYSRPSLPVFEILAGKDEMDNPY